MGAEMSWGQRDSMALRDLADAMETLVAGDYAEEIRRHKLALHDVLAGLAMNRGVRERRVEFILREGRLPENETGEPT